MGTLMGTPFAYSWIARQLQVGRTLAFLLARANFKSETSFGFLSPDYTGQLTFFFAKPKNDLV